jgi:hypothetical protein
MLKKSASKKAFSENLSAEMHAGKPQKQAVTIAYSQQRAAQKSQGKSVSHPQKAAPRKSAGRGR